MSAQYKINILNIRYISLNVMTSVLKLWTVKFNIRSYLYFLFFFKRRVICKMVIIVFDIIVLRI